MDKLILPSYDPPLDLFDESLAAIFLDADYNTTSAAELASLLDSPMPDPGSAVSAAPSGSASISVIAEENSDDSHEVVINVVATEVVPRKRKRGRRPKADAGSPTAPAKKMKLYEYTQPFDDEAKEKRRLNAIKAREHRQLEKRMKEALRKEMQEVQSEVAGLRSTIETLHMSLAELEETKKKWRFGIIETSNALKGPNSE
ncbi:uncharacterized protein LOC135202337 isoform X2 [Macrobrachium nipponense]|uniref:uncharacterized protein LOC135202337 isoform X2 n=1 Tax=Macrobrachium nipponense TaxID=159736 RepID=UPI0030C7A880